MVSGVNITEQTRHGTVPDHHCHCEGAARGNLLVFGGDKLGTEGKHNPLAPRIYEGGARRAGGVLPQCEFAGRLQ